MNDWKIQSDQYFGVGIDTGRRIVHVGRPEEDDDVDEVATVITRAVNCHQALVEACRSALERLEDPYLGEDDGQRQQPEIEKLKSALAKVKEQTPDLVDDMPVLRKVERELLKININSSVEHPGYLEIKLNNGETFAFGFANGPFGWDKRNENGEVRAVGVSDLTQRTSPRELAIFCNQIIDSNETRDPVPGLSSNGNSDPTQVTP